MAQAKNKNKGATNDGLALIVGGMFVLALVFATYSYFNRTPKVDVDDMASATTERLEGADSTTLSLGDRIKELFNSEDMEDKETPAVAGDSDIVFDDTLGKGGPKVLYSVWTATDYQEGDITASTYIVVEGDTLWEIAEARYGNGADWTKIVEANMGNVGYLPNGQQALITVGQSLVLP